MTKREEARARETAHMVADFKCKFFKSVLEAIGRGAPTPAEAALQALRCAEQWKQNWLVGP